MLEKLLVRPFLILIFKLLFDVKVKGIENYYTAGGKVLIISNHVSFLDPLLIATFMPEKPAFAMNVLQADKWYFRWLKKVVKIYRLDPMQPMSMKKMIQDLRKGAHVVFFPEGRITTSGGIMKIYEGATVILEKTGATLLQVRIDGAEYSKLSKLSRKLRQRHFPKIRMTVFPPMRFEPEQKVSPRIIYDAMTDAAFATFEHHRSLLAALLDACKLHGGAQVIASDISRAEMNYRSLFTRAFVLRNKLKTVLGDEQYVGLMLPNALAALVTFFSLHMLGKIPCMLNFSSGEANMLHACRIANVKTIITSRQFIAKGKLDKIAEALQQAHKLVYLEDIRDQIIVQDKLDGFWQALNAPKELQTILAATRPDDPAVVLYTSGSEGVPKGVALSHANLLANLSQACARLDLMPADIVFNSLPVFHSFGLTIGMIMPVMRGIKTFLYPSPLHYRIIPELIYDTDATIMLGTDTFFKGYARYANPYDFWSVRLAVAGAEKLRDGTRRLYADTFNVNIMEGYGVTETSPAISFNTPLAHKAGTVGRPFPGMETRLEPVPGLDKGGRLFIKGPNVMLGYLKADQPGVIQSQGEWYDTGDIVDIDADGFITILGRAKRFAKIGGEMVSLLAVEELAAGLLPEAAHAAIAMPDERKGEHIILFTEAKELTKDILIHHAREKGVAEICLPKEVVCLEAIPRLGNGKIDYLTLAKNKTGN